MPVLCHLFKYSIYFFVGTIWIKIYCLPVQICLKSQQFPWGVLSFSHECMYVYMYLYTHIHTVYTHTHTDVGLLLSIDLHALILYILMCVRQSLRMKGCRVGSGRFFISVSCSWSTVFEVPYYLYNWLLLLSGEKNTTFYSNLLFLEQ